MAEDVKAAEGATKVRKGKEKAGGAAAAQASAVLTPAEAQIARMLVRSLWAQEMIAANPEQTPAERAALWKEARQARIDAELKKVRRALLSLKKAGVAMTLSEKAAEPGDDAEA